MTFIYGPVGDPLRSSGGMRSGVYTCKFHLVIITLKFFYLQYMSGKKPQLKDPNGLWCLLALLF